VSSRKILIGVAAVLAIASAVILFQDRTIQAQDNGSSSELAALSAKVDEILKCQKDIVKDIASIKEQLDVIRLRVTQNQ